MATAAQLVEETEHESEIEYRSVVLTAAGNSTPTEARKIILPPQKLHGNAAAGRFKLTTLEPRVCSDWEPFAIGGAQLGGSLVGKVGAENWATEGPLEVIF